MTHNAAKIQVYNKMSSFLNDCNKIGEIESIGEVDLIDMIDLSDKSPVKIAKIKLREAALKNGGDTVVITEVKNYESILKKKVVLKGVSLKCNKE
tara:strand:- start:512 stop:796 length:285 start_codon:yes stop_codon:yes gene_type:complete